MDGEDEDKECGGEDEDRGAEGSGVKGPHQSCSNSVDAEEENSSPQEDPSGNMDSSSLPLSLHHSLSLSLFLHRRGSVC